MLSVFSTEVYLYLTTSEELIETLSVREVDFIMFFHLIGRGNNAESW